MRKSSYKILPKTEKILKVMGEQIKLARLRRDLRVELVAERAGISRATLWKVENGDPSVAMGIYAAVLHALNDMDDDLEELTPSQDAEADDMMNIAVIAESTPGPMAINCATFTGYRQAGFFGSLAATAGIILPSFLVIFIISMFLDNFLEITVIANAFKGIKLAVGILILDAAVKMVKKMKRGAFPRMIMLCSFAAMLLINIFSWSFSTISLMLIAAAVSLAASFASGAKRKEGEGT